MKGKHPLHKPYAQVKKQYSNSYANFKAKSMPESQQQNLEITNEHTLGIDRHSHTSEIKHVSLTVDRCFHEVDC